jgi:hypothetical protein
VHFYFGARVGHSGLRYRYGFFGDKRGVAKKNCPCLSLAQLSPQKREVTAK